MPPHPYLSGAPRFCRGATARSGFNSCGRAVSRVRSHTDLMSHIVKPATPVFAALSIDVDMFAAVHYETQARIVRLVAARPSAQERLDDSQLSRTSDVPRPGARTRS